MDMNKMVGAMDMNEVLLLMKACHERKAEALALLQLDLQRIPLEALKEKLDPNWSGSDQTWPISIVQAKVLVERFGFQHPQFKAEILQSVVYLRKLCQTNYGLIMSSDQP